MFPSEDDGSLARPPMHLFGRHCSRSSTIPEDERVESEFSGSDESDDAGLEEPGGFSAGGMENDDLDSEGDSP